MTAYAFRPWAEGDDIELLQLFSDPESSQVPWYRSAFGANSDVEGAIKRTIVATDQSIPVAAGVVWQQQLHPTRLSAYVEVTKDHRGAGLGRELLTQLRAAVADAGLGEVPLSVKVDAGTAGERFARSLGLEEVQRSGMYEISAGALALPRFPVPESGVESDAGSDVVSDLATGSVELSTALATWYQAVHAHWNPTVEMTLGLAQQYFLSDATGAQGAIVLRAEPSSSFGGNAPARGKGRIRAFGVSYGPYTADRSAADWSKNDSAADVLLGWDPQLSDQDAATAVRDLLALLAHQHPVVLHIDSDMVALRATVDPLVSTGRAARLAAETIVFSD